MNNKTDGNFDYQLGPFSSVKAHPFNYVEGDCAVESVMLQSKYKGRVKVSSELLRLT